MTESRDQRLHEGFLVLRPGLGTLGTPPPQWLSAPGGEEKALIFGSPVVWREGAWHTGGDWEVFQPPLGNYKMEMSWLTPTV